MEKFAYRKAEGCIGASCAELWTLLVQHSKNVVVEGYTSGEVELLDIRIMYMNGQYSQGQAGICRACFAASSKPVSCVICGRRMDRQTRAMQSYADVMRHVRTTHGQAD